MFNIDIDSDYVENVVYDYDDYVECNNDTEEVFVIGENTGDMSSRSLAVSLGFAEEIAAAEAAEYKVEYGIDRTDVDMPIIGGTEMISLMTNTKNKINLRQRDPHFLDYVKQICNGGDTENHIQTPWKEIF